MFYVFMENIYIVLNVFLYSLIKVNEYLPVSGTTKTSGSDEFPVEVGLWVGWVWGTKDGFVFVSEEFWLLWGVGCTSTWIVFCSATNITDPLLESVVSDIVFNQKFVFFLGFGGKFQMAKCRPAEMGQIQ